MPPRHSIEQSDQVDPVDQAFLRFQEKGKADDLAEVFDATVSPLLRVAQHIAPDLNTAEDLVQATFLVAIERRQDYVPKGNVLSWLTGILYHRAHHSRRASGREPELEDRLLQEHLHAPRREHLQERPVAHPAETLQGKEFSQAVTQAIARLPAIYRPVLNLHLRAGRDGRSSRPSCRTKGPQLAKLAATRGSRATLIVSGASKLAKALDAPGKVVATPKFSSVEAHRGLRAGKGNSNLRLFDEGCRDGGWAGPRAHWIGG